MINVKELGIIHSKLGNLEDEVQDSIVRTLEWNSTASSVLINIEHDTTISDDGNHKLINMAIHMFINHGFSVAREEGATRVLRLTWSI